MIYLIDNKFKQIIYEEHINKHEKLNLEINQHVQDAKQMKTWFLKIHFSGNYVNFYILFDSIN